jgi:hypothetical protein
VFYGFSKHALSRELCVVRRSNSIDCVTMTRTQVYTRCRS